ncbi:MAG: AAA family ATPase [Candidatus Falkowbacteria bacterium]
MSSKPTYLICETCSGSGRANALLACSTCHGAGVGKTYHGRFYFWAEQINQATIALRILERRFNQLVDLFFLVFGFSGFGALVWWWLETGPELSSAPWLWWEHRHWLLLWFWLGVLAWLFSFFRINKDPVFSPRVSHQATDAELLLIDEWSEVRKIAGSKRVEVSTGFNYASLAVVEEALALASRLGHSEVTPLHLFLVLLSDEQSYSVLTRLNVNVIGLSKKIKTQLQKIQAPVGSGLHLSLKLRQALVDAYIQAEIFEQSRVKPANLLLASLENDVVLEELLYEQEVDRDKLNNAVQWFRIHERLIERFQAYRRTARFKPSTNMDRAYTAVATPLLNAFSRDLTLAARWFRLEMCVGREREMDELFQVLDSGRNGVLLVGEVGVGKKSIVHGLAQLMVEEKVPKYLQDKRMLELDISRLVSGATAAQAQERLLACLDEISHARNIILFINNIETITGISSGGESSADLSDVLVSVIEHHGIVCLASVTIENYRKFIEGKPIDHAMGTVRVAEPVGNQAILMLESKVAYLEGVYKVYFTYNAIEEAIKLTSKYMHDRYLPAKAVAALEAAAVRVSKSKQDKVVGREAIDLYVTESTGIPLTQIGLSESKKLLNLEAQIHEHMIDQVEAVDMVAASLRRARAQMTDGKRPIASFLFMGPTGVGKTELAKSVAKVYFGDEKYMIRLDMSEYQTQDTVGKMIGSANEKGYLTELVRQSPFCILLLDEFEKAHPEILNLFLQVMDDGRLTDGQGKTIDFTNCIIIATSNAGALYIQEQMKKGTPVNEIKEVLINEQLNKIMRPELINRFDGIIVFKPLAQEDVVAIAKLLLKKIEKMLKEKGIRLRLEEEGVILLANQGFDPKFGARPLRRLLQDKVENIIANKILSGEARRRDTIVIDRLGEVQIEKAQVL